jgi:hypothetical protein
VKATRRVAVLLIVAGVIGLIYQQLNFTKDPAQPKLGTLDVSANEKENLNVPLWASLGAIGVGVVVLVSGGRRK